MVSFTGTLMPFSWASLTMAAVQSVDLEPLSRLDIIIHRREMLCRWRTSFL